MNTFNPISDHRFRIPLNEQDIFHPISSEEGTMDLLRFKSDAEDSAWRKADQLQSMSGSVAEKLWTFLTQRHYRKGPNAFVDSARSSYLTAMEKAIHKSEPLSLAMSFMPVKVRHPLKSFATTGSEVDIGEIGSLLRMYEIAFGLSRLYDGGVQMQIVSDGARYEHVFGYGKDEHHVYKENLKKAIRYLGIDRYVTLIDEGALYPPDFAVIRQRCLEDVQRLFRGGDTGVCELACQLESSIALSIPVDSSVSLKTLVTALNSQISDDMLRRLCPDALDVRASVMRRLRPTIEQYIAVNRAVAACSIFGALKVTAHPKPHELGLHTVNQSARVFPYHGQGLVKKKNGSHPSLDSIRVEFTADLMRENVDGIYRGIVLSPHDYPFADGKHPFAIMHCT